MGNNSHPPDARWRLEDRVAARSSGAAPDDHVLLELIAHRDQSALAEAYDRHVRPVAWLARSMLPSHLVDDAIQATFLTLWTKAGRIQLSGDSLLPWLLGVCRQHSRALGRKERRHFHAEIDPAVPDSSDLESLAIQRQLISAVERHVARLGDVDRQIYRLCILEDLSYGAAAARIGVTTSTVRNRLSRLRAGLRSRFGGN